MNRSEVFFPFRKTVFLRTKLHKEEVALRMQELVRPATAASGEIFHFSTPYVRKTSNTGFVVEDRASILTPFSPKIAGEVHGDISGTSIKVVFSMNTFTLFLGIVMSLPLIMSLVQVFNFFQFPPQLTNYLSFGAFGFLLTCYVYRQACNAATKILNQNLESAEFKAVDQER